MQFRESMDVTYQTMGARIVQSSMKVSVDEVMSVRSLCTCHRVCVVMHLYVCVYVWMVSTDIRIGNKVWVDVRLEERVEDCRKRNEKLRKTPLPLRQ